MKAIILKSRLQKVIGACAILILLSSLSVIAQNTMKNAAINKLTRFELKPAYSKQFRTAISKYVKQSLSEEGNIMAEAYYEKEHPSVLWLIERWTSNTGSNKFRKTFESLATTALAKPAKVYTVKDLEPLTKQQWRKTARKQDQQLTVMLFVDAKKGTQQDFKRIYHQAMPQFRSEPGVVTYQLSEIEGDDTQFVTYEKFRSEEAFQYHLKFPPIQPVIDYLNTSIKQSPFQNGIRNLVEFAPLTRE